MNFLLVIFNACLNIVNYANYDLSSDEKTTNVHNKKLKFSGSSFTPSITSPEKKMSSNELLNTYLKIIILFWKINNVFFYFMS